MKRTVLLVALVAAAGSAGFLAHRSVAAVPPEHTVTTVADHTVVEKIENVLKVVTIEMHLANYKIQRDARPRWYIPGSCEKTIAALYRVKVAAGFDLKKTPAIVSLDDKARVLHVALPAPSVLYVDMAAPDLLLTDGSICNSITPDDIKRIANDLHSQLQQDAINDGILIKASEQAKTLLGALAAAENLTLDLRIDASATTSEPPPKG